MPPHWSKNNPVDIIADTSDGRYFKTIKVADDFNADATYVIITPQCMTSSEAVCKLFVEQRFKLFNSPWYSAAAIHFVSSCFL